MAHSRDTHRFPVGERRAVYALALGAGGLRPVLRHDAVDHRRRLRLGLVRSLVRSDHGTAFGLRCLGAVADRLLIALPVVAIHADLQGVQQVPHVLPVHAVQNARPSDFRKGNRTFTVRGDGVVHARDRVRHVMLL